jgi:small-conductance mechanosensitive channel
VATSDYLLYMNIQQQINLQLMERFEREGIRFAHPTQTLFLNN